MIELKTSSKECKRLWLDSLANKKAGADIELNNCISRELASAETPVRCGAILFSIASIAGYTAVSLPWLWVMSV